MILLPESHIIKEAPDLLFCPTETAVKILGTEGIESGVYHIDPTDLYLSIFCSSQQLFFAKVFFLKP